jgi:hypothetical protein
LDLTDLQFTSLLRQSHADLENDYRNNGLALPQNTGRDLKLRKLDCLVINSLSPTILDEVHTVRGAFEEGNEAFPGAALRMETHIQVAVRNRRCILGVFRPTLTGSKVNDE